MVRIAMAPIPTVLILMQMTTGTVRPQIATIRALHPMQVQAAIDRMATPKMNIVRMSIDKMDTLKMSIAKMATFRITMRLAAMS